MAQLLRAAANGNLDKVIELRNDWGFQNKKGDSVLHVAVAEDQLKIVQHLVSNGAMLNLQDKKRRFTPLMLALAQQPPCFEEIFQALLKGKPDLSVQDSSGQTVLHLAAGASYEYEKPEALKLLLRAKPKVDAVDNQKMTALHVAVGKGNFEIVQFLIESGQASVNVSDGKGNTPLYVPFVRCSGNIFIFGVRDSRHWACIKNGSTQLEIIKYLIDKGAKPLKNSRGNSPLHSEAMHCDPTANWPTAAAEILTTAFPDLIAEVNNNGLTARQTFEQDIDAEDPVEEAPVKSFAKINRRSKDKGESIHGNTLAARAAAIAHSRKKVVPISKQGTSMAPYVWAALIFAVVAVLSALLST